MIIQIKMGMRILRKKKLWAHTGFDHPLNSEQFLHKLKKKSVKRVIIFHEIVNVLTKFCDFLENCCYFDRKKNFFCLCNTVPDSLSRSLIFSIFTISLCIFFTGLEFGKKKRLFWWKKKFLSKQHCVKTAPSGVKKKINLREI